MEKQVTKSSHLLEQKATLQRCNDMLRMNSNAFNMYIQKGTALLYLSEPEKAHECFKELTSKNDKSEHGYLYQGIALFAQKDFQSAQWWFDKALAMNRENLKNMEFYFKGKCIWALQHSFPKALDSFDEGIKSNPENPLNYCGKGELYLEDGKEMEALEFLEEAHQRQENCPLHGKYLFLAALAHLYARIDLVIENESDLKKSLKLFKQAQSFHPYQDELCLYEGNAQTKLWKVQKHKNDHFAYGGQAQQSMIMQALTSYEKALKLEPKNAIALNNAGIAHQELGNFDRALQNFDAAINLNPLNPLFRFNRGKCYYNLAFNKTSLEYEAKAVQDFQEVSKLADNVQLLKQQNLSDGNLNLIVSTLKTIFQALGLAGKARIISNSLDSDKKNSSEKLNELEKKRFAIVNQILNEGALSNEKNENSLLGLITELQASLTQVEEKLRLKLDDFKKIFDEKLQSLQLVETHQELLKAYRTSFAITFSAALGSAEAINGEGLSIDTGNDWTGALSFLAGCVPLFGSQLSSSIEKISDIWMEGTIKTRAKLLTHAFPTRSELDQLVLEISCLIISDEQKRNAIIKGSFSDAGPQSKFDQVINFFSRLKDKCQINIPDLHPTTQHKIGNEDANILLEVILEGNKLKAQDCLKILKEKVYDEKKFCDCVYSNPIKKSVIIKKKCTQCTTPVKEFYKCASCKIKIRFCISCYNQYFNKQAPQQQQ